MHFDLRASRLGRFLFRFRGLIGFLAFVLVYLTGRPSRHSLASGLVPLVLGMALRVWAAAHLGAPGRSREVSAPELITSGPYRFVRNPLYFANFLLVLGSLVALGCRWWIALVVFLLFVIEYSLIVHAEEKELAERFGAAYRDYQQNVPAILPRRARPGAPSSFDWKRARGELTTLVVLAAVYLLAWLEIALRHV